MFFIQFLQRDDELKVQRFRALPTLTRSLFFLEGLMRQDLQLPGLMHFLR